MKHVIIGASVAGMTAAARIKELSPEQEVTVLSGRESNHMARCPFPICFPG